MLIQVVVCVAASDDLCSIESLNEFLHSDMKVDLAVFVFYEGQLIAFKSHWFAHFQFLSRSPLKKIIHLLNGKVLSINSYEVVNID